MPSIRIPAIVACTSAALLVGSTPANASDPNPTVGVNGCSVISPGDYVEAQCRSITTPGYYYLSTHGNGGFVSIQVNCTQGGSMSTSDFTWGYLNGGVCTVFIYSQYWTTGQLGAYS